jgi:hypothetical protein
MRSQLGKNPRKYKAQDGIVQIPLNGIITDNELFFFKVEKSEEGDKIVMCDKNDDGAVPAKVRVVAELNSGGFDQVSANLDDTGLRLVVKPVA